MTDQDQATTAEPQADDAHNERMIDGRYEVDSILGEGGFGVVYRAQQVSTGQLVAVKVMHTDLVEDNNKEEYLGRFEREMKLIARLKHPNIVRLIDSGTLPTGEPFTVLEYIEGETLFDVVEREGPMRPREALRIMFQVLDALSSAHKIGIVHRDLKPQNIMLTTTGYRRNAMVLDFGIAAVTKEQRSVDYKTLTKASEVCGTPNYMAPEQLSSKVLTEQSDIYAWGLVFIEALTGQPAVDGEGPLDIVFTQIDMDIPVELPDGLVNEELEAIIRKATTKPLDDRFKTAAEVLGALESSSLIDADGRAKGGSLALKLDTGKPLAGHSTPTNDSGTLSDAATVKFDIESYEKSKEKEPDPEAERTTQKGLKAHPNAAPQVIVQRPDATRQALLLLLATLIALAVGGLVGFVVGSGNAEGSTAAAAEKPAQQRIAVLPFTVTSGAEALSTVPASLSKKLDIELSKLKRFEVIASSTLDSAVGKDPKTIAAENPGVTAVLTSELQAVDGKVQLSMSLVDASDGALLWGMTHNDSLRNPIILESELISAIISDFKLNTESLFKAPDKD